MFPTYLVLHGGSLDVGGPIQAVLSCRTPHRLVEVASYWQRSIIWFSPHGIMAGKSSPHALPLNPEWVVRILHILGNMPWSRVIQARRFDTSWWYSNQQRYRPRLAQIRSDSSTRIVFFFHHLYFLVHIIALMG